jgi:hypothetical protein
MSGDCFTGDERKMSLQHHSVAKMLRIAAGRAEALLLLFAVGAG